MSIRSLYFLSCLTSALCVLPTHADESNLYGPIRSGQSLSQIAVKIRPDNSVTIAQILSAIYDLNPEAFDKGNMNLLKKGVKLKIPEKEEMLSITHQQAKRQVAHHAEALKALLADAKKLNLAKRNYKTWKIKAYKLQKRLNRQRHKSKTWRRTYKKLSYAKKRRALALKKITLQREKLLAKAEIKIDKKTAVSSTTTATSTSLSATRSVKPKKESILSDSIKQTNSNTQPTSRNKMVQSNLDEMDSRINKVQKQMQSLISTQKKETRKRKQQIASLQEQLKVSNKKLESRIQAQAKMEERFTLLEGELGRKEKIILTLRSALLTAANTMKKQQVENQKLQERLKKLNPKDTLLQYGRLQLHDSNSTHIDEKY